MGQPKASLPFGSNTLLGSTVDMLLGCTFPVVVVARDEGQAADLPPISLEADLALDQEAFRGRGPVAGLLTGLLSLAGRSDAAFVTGCDAPFLTPSVVEWLANQLGDHDVVVPRFDDVLQPLCAVYRVTVAEAAARALEGDNASLHELIQQTRAQVLPEAVVTTFDRDARFLRGVNSPEEYQAALRDADESDPG